MKVEYLPGASRIRIMDFNREELRELRRTFVRLARGTENSVSICSINGVQCLNGIDLLLQRMEKDEGIKLRHTNGMIFRCRLSRDGWLEANGKAKSIERAIGPGCSNDLNYDGDVLLLLSYDGKW
jgi:hypothetical protein